jgi:riboflavin synthase alpha subunit
MKLETASTDTWYKVTWTKQEHALKLKKPTVVGIILLYDEALNNLTIEKGSITVNGVSLQ